MAVLRKEVTKYQKQKMSIAKGDALLQRLSAAMDEERYYLDAKIKLPQLATILEVSPHEISQVINDRLGVSFNHYINDYRVKAACEMLEHADHLTVEGIGREVGFNSRSAFYAAFKQQMAQTPAQYKAQLNATA
ncbi:MAG: helix-turn-helix domain-containing protein [Bacteroidota bacterium]